MKGMGEGVTSLVIDERGQKLFVGLQGRVMAIDVTSGEPPTNPDPDSNPNPNPDSNPDPNPRLYPLESWPLKNRL